MVGAAAGGPTDTIARILAQHMRASLRQAIIIENNGTAGGTIAHGRTARAFPDGYTLSLGHTGTHVLNGAVYSLLYDVLKDFEPVSLVCSNPWLFAAKSTLPPDDLQGFIGWLKANPGTLQGLGAIGAPDHVAGVLLQSTMGIRWQFVPYRGSAPLMQDLVDSTSTTQASVTTGAAGASPDTTIGTNAGPPRTLLPAFFVASAWRRQRNKRLGLMS
jgi:tripartite-type tricarboxylate transporter receptor subunit TctC